MFIIPTSSLFIIIGIGMGRVELDTIGQPAFQAAAFIQRLPQLQWVLVARPLLAAVAVQEAEEAEVRVDKPTAFFEK